MAENRSILPFMLVSQLLFLRAVAGSAACTAGSSSCTAGGSLLQKSVRGAGGVVQAQCAQLKSENNGTHYTALVKVGTPAQTFNVVADTGSNSLIIPSCYCQDVGSCSKKQGRCFRGTNKSSTFFMEPLATRQNTTGQQELLITFGSGQVECLISM